MAARKKTTNAAATGAATTFAIPETSQGDPRLAILNSFLKSPHAKMELVVPIHRQIEASDPIFYRQLAAFYADKGAVRDHQDAFVIGLVLSSNADSRNVGLALFRELPVYRAARVVQYIRGGTRRVKVYTDEQKKAYATAVQAAQKAAGKDKEARRAAAKAVPRMVPTYQEEVYGLDHFLPRSMKTEIYRYLSDLEADDDAFDFAAMQSRDNLRKLYSLSRTAPSERANKILFEDVMPEGTRLEALRNLANTEDPTLQAAMIIQNNIPYRLATSAVKEMTPTVLLALISVMSPQEVINSIGSLNNRGAMANPDLKAAIDAKLKKAQGDKRVSALKSKTAAAAVAGLDEGTKKSLDDVADKQIKKGGTITRPTAILIDKSPSQQQSLALGKQLAAAVSGVCESDLIVYAFDSMPYPIKASGKTLTAWEKAFVGINISSGGTSCGAPLAMMTRNRELVDQIVMISDGEENTSPTFVSAYQAYCRATGKDPDVIMIWMPGGVDVVSGRCQAAGIPFEKIEWGQKGQDYYSIPNLITRLSKGTKLDMLMTVMSYPLPQRRAS